MSPSVALTILNWIVILILFLAVGALLREVRMLRALVVREVSYSSAGPDLVLGATVTDGADRVVLASDTGCPLCGAVTARLAELAGAAGVRPVLLTYEDVEQWPEAVRQEFDVVSDRDEWQKIAHLSPPVLMAVRADGRVVDLALPVDVGSAERQFDLVRKKIVHREGSAS
ncbi:hypothetical protein JMF97_12310 [Micromonospora fiedleri]|uniref:Thioredoxin domain-containing protein n=1 Tax=Micromonospora fiedleri TaxID=1157498 RepID=A0ABS1UL45_9ACTN|nr:MULTISPECIES: hypothetical protein [Micromonospora]MBL6276944.1 hypothetical protein [Micromonospora fiedleri]WSK43345.1 hypothetical protein OG712_04060 [Micromonospora maris]